jgi:glycosyltransferase involved in cell wall biosynthesis
MSMRPDRRPDLALIAPYPPAGERHGGHSGVASYTANLAHGLAATGLDVEVIAPELDGDPPEFSDGPIAVRRSFPMGRRALPCALRAAAERAARVVHLQFELFLYGGPSALVGLVPALGAAHRTLGETPLVTTMHQVVEPSTIDRRYTRLHRVAAPAVVARNGIAGVQSAISRAGAATIVHEEPFKRILPAATVIPHGIEDVAPMARDAARRQLALDDRFVVLCFGFLAPYKGIELVLDAARRMRPGIQVVIAGGEHPRMADGNSFGAELRDRYGDVARFTGWVPDGDVSAWFSAADLCVFPYPKPFASSGVLALALAHGAPVLLSPALARCAGAPSVLTSPMAAGPLARRIEALTDNPDALAELADWSGVLAAGRRWSSVSEQHARLYEEVLDVDRHTRRRVRAR